MSNIDLDLNHAIENEENQLEAKAHAKDSFDLKLKQQKKFNANSITTSTCQLAAGAFGFRITQFRIFRQRPVFAYTGKCNRASYGNYTFQW